MPDGGLKMTEQTAISHPLFMAYVGDMASHAVLRDFAAAAGLPEAVVQPGGLGVLTEIVTGGGKLPKIILVDIDESADPLPTLTRLVEALEDVSRVIAIGSANDARLFRSLLSAGAADYLVKPLTVEMVQAAYATSRTHQKDETKNGKATTGRIVPVIGARGGVGATTLSVNLGWLLAHRQNMMTALVDLDLQYGTSTLALDLPPGRGLREALDAPGRLDSLLVASAMVSESDRFSILGAEEPLESHIHFDGAASLAVTSTLKDNFDLILMDLPRHLLASHQRLVAEADTIIIVADQSLPAVRDVVRLKAALKMMAPNAHLLVAINRSGRAHQLDKDTFEKGVGAPVVAIIPEDADPMAEAANRGQALGKVAPHATATLAMAKLAALLAGVEESATAPAKSGKLQGLLHRLSGKDK